MNSLKQHCNPRNPVTVQAMENHRDIITNLFETHTLPEVREIMERDHNFFATVAQYKKRKTAWKIGPNIPKQKMVQMLRKHDRRWARGKNTIYRFHGQVVTREKLERGRRRFKNELSRLERSSSLPNSPALSDVECMTPRSASPEMNSPSPMMDFDSVSTESTTLPTLSLPKSPLSHPSSITNTPNFSGQLLYVSNTDPKNYLYPQLNAASTASDTIFRPSGAMSDENDVITIPRGLATLPYPWRHAICEGQDLRQDRSRSRDILSSGVDYNLSILMSDAIGFLPKRAGKEDPHLLSDDICQSPRLEQKQTRMRCLFSRIEISVSYNPTSDANGTPLYEAFFSMGVNLSGIMSYEDAREYFHRALANIESLERTCRGHRNILLFKHLNLVNLSALYIQKSNFEKAREFTQLVLDGFKVTLRETNLKFFATAQMGSIFLSIGDYEKAQNHLNEALHGYRMCFWDDINEDEAIAMILEELAVIYIVQGQDRRALELFRQVQWRYERSMSSCSPRLLRRILGTGETCETLGDSETALVFYKLALYGWNSLQDWGLETHPDRLWTLHNLGTFYRKQGDYEMALHFCTQVMKGLNLNDDKANDDFGYTPESYRDEFAILARPR